MRQIRRTVLLLLLALVLVYVGDDLSARFRLPGNRQTLGTVDVQIFWAIRQKDGRIDYEVGDTETQTCIRSLFPHLGYTPCWYLSGHTRQVVRVGQAIPSGAPLRYPVNSCLYPLKPPEPICSSSSSSRCGHSAT